VQFRMQYVFLSSIILYGNYMYIFSTMYKMTRKPLERDISRISDGVQVLRLAKKLKKKKPSRSRSARWYLGNSRTCCKTNKIDYCRRLS
jgi:hypothetical protein